MSNPAWTRDELILALDLYFRLRSVHPSHKHPEVIALSALLNKLPIHRGSLHTDTFRKPNSVCMKLRNFMSFDPTDSGVGLWAVAKRDEEVWNEFASKQEQLHQIATNIRATVEDDSLLGAVASVEDDYCEAAEGRVLSCLRRFRERNRELADRKKAKALKEAGRLPCDVCGLDFKEQYGDIGENFIECHHLKPLATLDPGAKTKLADLALVCSKCHRMLHRGKPWPTTAKLRTRLGKMSFRRLEQFQEYLDTLPSDGGTMIWSRLNRGAANQIDFLRNCHDRLALERHYVSMSRYGIWSETVAEIIEGMAGGMRPEEGSEAIERLRMAVASLRVFADMQERFSLQEFC